MSRNITLPKSSISAGNFRGVFKADTQMTLRQRFMNMIILGVFPFADFQYSIQ